ncbi:extracellular solute-binding protein [Marinomonas sp. M1K-6]|uniref:Extracellular solute-binding protein n=1 Tax=Marinomonas profundi TaxID=2726122 RepID=A0A847R3M4_9GAMM|nr:extracellular solute-binding protein [Marinomonas profundi]NLQ16993.1 extracellular solute-binding protein [Marinomonas profundi]UDV02718.1 extracellular solute-binding protein [Marinomonas profundi]
MRYQNTKTLHKLERNWKKVVYPMAIAASLTTSFTWADTTIRMLHLEADPKVVSVWEQVAHDYEKANPGQTIKLEYLENEAFKQKLPTLLQSEQRPDIFYSWGGGNFQTRVDAGLLKDVSKEMEDVKSKFSDVSFNAFNYQGKQYGLPYMVSQVGFWYNKSLFQQAGVDADQVVTWDDFLGAIKKLQAAGITPITTAGGDKWPVQFYWALLTMRQAGQQGIQDAIDKKEPAFAGEDFIKAGEELKRLVDLKPFQSGHLAASFGDSSGNFGDGKSAMQLMGDWNYLFQAQQSISGKGVGDDNLGWMNFPVLKDGKGKATDTLGGIAGWVLTSEASPEAVQWLKYFSNIEMQKHLASINMIIPVVKGADVAIENPFKKRIAQNIANSSWHQLFYDQAFGANVGSVVNDVSAGILGGALSPQEAAEQVQEAWEFE